MTILAAEPGLVSQHVISEQIENIHADAHVGETQPRLDFPVPLQNTAASLTCGFLKLFTRPGGTR